MKENNISKILHLLRCPITGESLAIDGNELVNVSSKNHYPISADGIPLFAEIPQRNDSKCQQQHYDRISKSYIENLNYPHTQEYISYLDKAFINSIDVQSLGNSAEICCGTGEAFHLLHEHIPLGVGVDISIGMLSQAQKKLPNNNLYFIQGDATQLPLASDSFDSLFLFGGIHHVPDREKLFFEISRILKPGGTVYWREPVSDFWLWRVLRSIIYTLSPMLDQQTERPLLLKETEPFLKQAGLSLKTWKTYGFLGFCFFMNSDVLVFNRFFRFVPGIQFITRMAIKFDDCVIKLPFMSKNGLQVIGSAQKNKI